MAEVIVEYEVTLKIDMDTAEKLVALVGNCPYRDKETSKLFNTLLAAGIKESYKLIGHSGERIPVINFKKV